MQCKFIDVDCNCLPYQMPADCNDECWIFWQAQNTKNVEEGNKAIEENSALKTKLHNRNALVKKLREEIKELKKPFNPVG